MKRYKYVWVLLLVFVFSGCQSGKSGSEEAEILLRLAEAHPSDYPTTLADEEFARRVSEATDGRIQIVVYDTMALGEERSVIEQVQFGAIDLARVSTAPVGEFCEALNVLQLPYLYESREHMWRVLDSDIGDYFLEAVSDSGFIGLAWFDAGARSFYNAKHPIETVADLQGMKFRVLENQMMSDMVAALGAEAVPMAFGQVYEAIQVGDIDGAENNYPSYESSGHYKVAKYFTVDEHTRVPEILIASEKALESLSEADIQLLKTIAKETEAYQRDLWIEREEASRAYLEAYGIVFSHFSDYDTLKALTRPIYEPYEAEYGDLLKQISHQ